MQPVTCMHSLTPPVGRTHASFGASLMVWYVCMHKTTLAPRARWTMLTQGRLQRTMGASRSGPTRSVAVQWRDASTLRLPVHPLQAHPQHHPQHHQPLSLPQHHQPVHPQSTFVMMEAMGVTCMMGASASRKARAGDVDVMWGMSVWPTVKRHRKHTSVH